MPATAIMPGKWSQEGVSWTDSIYSSNFSR